MRRKALRVVEVSARAAGSIFLMFEHNRRLQPSPRASRRRRHGLTLRVCVLSALCQLGSLVTAFGPMPRVAAQEEIRIRPGWPRAPRSRRTPPQPAIGRPDELRPVIGVDRRTRVRIEKALEYLYRNQNPNGSWTDRVGRKVHNSYWGENNQHVGVTALVGIAFLAGGTLPSQGPRGKYCIAVRKALEYIMEQTGENGFISTNGSRMYSHAFATLFLAEAIGTGIYSDDRRVRETLKRSVRLMVNAQNDQGGWRYLPQAPDADMSVTVCQVFALRAARNAGIKVPKGTIDGAVRYVKESFNAEYGGFNYQVDRTFAGLRSRCTFPLTACGLATLYGAGEYDAYELRAGLRFMWDSYFPADMAPNRFDYFYGHYYGVQAAYQAGGAYWTKWYSRIREDLLSVQAPDGSWTDLVGSNYATAMAVIILQMPYQYLPITES